MNRRDAAGRFVDCRSRSSFPCPIRQDGKADD
jgi:hypothetical protein